jgi:hypothetical protein
VLGFAGASFSMASGACAVIGQAHANTPPQQTHEIFLSEEEISDVMGCGCGGCHVLSGPIFSSLTFLSLAHQFRVRLHYAPKVSAWPRNENPVSVF